MTYARSRWFSSFLFGFVLLGCGTESGDGVADGEYGADGAPDGAADGDDDGDGATDEHGTPGTGEQPAVTKVRVSPTSGLSTREHRGDDSAAEFTVELTSAPTRPVTIRVFSSDEGEGTVNTAQLVFTPEHWSPQKVIVSGVDDHETDGNQRYQIVLDEAVSEDTRYQGAPVQDVTLVNLDDDLAGITLTYPSDVHTSESGDVASFTVQLNTKPTHKVLIPVSISPTDEATLDTILLSFYPRDWDVPQTFQVKGVDDWLEEAEPQPFTITFARSESEDPAYLGIDLGHVDLVNRDDEADALFVKPLRTRVDEASELQDPYTRLAMFELRLRSQPTRNVTVKVTRAADALQSDTTLGTFTFTPSTWRDVQQVTENFRSDEYALGERRVEYHFTVESDDPDYRELATPPSYVEFVDDDVARVYVYNFHEVICERGDDCCAFTTVSLGAEPLRSTKLKLTVSDPTAATLSDTDFEFGPGLQTYQYLTVCGVDDDVRDGDQAFTVTARVVSSGDPAYAHVEPGILSMTTEDDD